MWRRILMSKEAGMCVCLVLMSVWFARALPFIIALVIFCLLAKAGHGGDEW